VTEAKTIAKLKANNQDMHKALKLLNQSFQRVNVEAKTYKQELQNKTEHLNQITKRFAERISVVAGLAFELAESSYGKDTPKYDIVKKQIMNAAGVGQVV